MIGSFLRQFPVGWWSRLPRTLREMFGSPTAMWASCDCPYTMSCSRFRGPHSDARILQPFWPQIFCTAACGLDFLTVVSPGFVTDTFNHPTQLPMGWAAAASISFGLTRKARFGSPLRVDSVD